MEKIVTEYGTTRIYKNVITIDANPKAVNEVAEELILEHHIRLERKDDGSWAHYENCTYWDDDADAWCLSLNRDGSMPCYGVRETLLEALWYAWVCILGR